MQHVISEPFEPSPFIPNVSKGFENDFNMTAGRQQKDQNDVDPVPSCTNEKEISTRENNVAKIKVVVCWSIKHWDFLCVYALGAPKLYCM